MSTAMSYQSIYSFVSHQSSTISQSSRQPLLLPTKCFKIDSSLCYYTSRRKRNLSKIEATASQTSVSYNTTLLSPSKNTIPDNSQKKSKKGVEEAIEAGKRISNIPIDVIFTSSLIRAQMTAMLSMIQHCRKKVPIILHNESDKAKSWSQVFSEETKDQSVPVIPAWQLNEIMYGELQGLNKQETAERYGKQQVHEWRRNYDIPPPKGESLEMYRTKACVGVKNGYDEVNIQNVRRRKRKRATTKLTFKTFEIDSSLRKALRRKHETSDKSSKRVAKQRLNACSARSLRSDRARAKLGRYVATERSFGARSLRSDRVQAGARSLRSD
ncbi:hypothetical protein DY000_02023859 [Brassica cretica]|uniref:phosphoglycerate mutase (2,3-diphosphoglycerate-dependent) n=1 Tax=Brassica cretica TaxID=69181 RepID=A0ABQ7E2Q7_BRACR|nr:hypothetical protein DY000_02023859 [Brassica cretica]